MTLWRIIFLLPLIACDRTGRVTSEKTDVQATQAVWCTSVGEAATFTGNAAHVESTCGCKYAGDNRPMGCGIPEDTCDSEYDLGGPNPHECTEVRSKTEIERLRASADRADCTVTARVNDDESTYSGSVTCRSPGLVRVTVVVTTDDVTAEASSHFDVVSDGC